MKCKFSWEKIFLVSLPSKDTHKFCLCCISLPYNVSAGELPRTKQRFSRLSLSVEIARAAGENNVPLDEVERRILAKSGDYRTVLQVRFAW